MKWWVGLWDRREHPRSLAAVRILLSTVLLWDLLRIWAYDLVVPLAGTHAAGGIGVPEGLTPTLWVFDLLGQGPGAAWALWGGMSLSCLMLLLGLLPRLAALVLVLLYAQFALVVPAADRGIDMLLRNSLLVLAFANSADTWSLTSKLRHGAFSAPEDTRIPAWPRYLLALQVVVLYFAAGVSKAASSWTPVGGLNALFIAMSDPHFQRWPDEWVRAIYPLTRVGTLVTWVWEWVAPVMLLAWWYRETADRTGRLRAWFNRWPIVEIYLVVGAIFHIGTHFTLRLGIFPFAVMSVYPSCVHPDALARLLDKLGARLTRRRRT